ncbi:MAG: hypothetical protein V4510_13080 [bacterium]
MQLDVNINATLEVGDEDWYELLESCDGDEDSAICELVNDLEYGGLDTMYGSAWVCSAEGIILMAAEEDTRPTGE